MANNRSAAYRKLADKINDELSSGLYPPGTPLPTEDELMAREGTSRHTVRRALAELVADGLVYRVAGRGTFAVPRPKSHRSLRIVGTIDAMFSVVQNTELLLLDEPLEVVDPEAAAALDADGDVVVEFRALRIERGVPFSFFTARVTPAMAAMLPRERLQPGIPTSDTISSLIGTATGTPATQIEQSISAAACPGEVAGYLGLAPGAPCLAIERIYHDRDGHVLEMVSAFHNSDRYNYEICLTARDA